MAVSSSVRTTWLALNWSDFAAKVASLKGEIGDKSANIYGMDRKSH